MQREADSSKPASQLLVTLASTNPDLWEPESCPFNHRKSFAARRGGVTQCGLMFPDGGSLRPGNRIFGRRWEQILGWMWVGVWWVEGTQGHLLESWTPLDWQQATLFPDTRRHCQSISSSHTWTIHTCQYSMRSHASVYKFAQCAGI